MDVNFNLTELEDYAKRELNARKLDIASIQNSSEGPISTKYWSSGRRLWARVISSADINGNSSYRKSSIMGTDQVHLPFEFLYDTGVNTNMSTDSPTNRPIFGLDSIKVAFEGPMGSTKSCTFNFKCWSVEHLENLEKLFMVPGISVILEWGWSITPDGTVVYPDDELKNLTPMADPYGTVMDRIISNRKKYSGNYDGFIGIITNFSWTANSDLGFECSVKLISPGEMWLEQNASNASKNCRDYSNDSNPQVHSNLEYIFHFLHKNCKGISNENRSKIADYNNLNVVSPIITSQPWKIPTSDYDKNQMGMWEKAKTYIREEVSPSLAPGAGYVPIVGDALKESLEDTTINDQVYISWAYFVALLNTNLNRYTTDQINFSTIANRTEIVDDICLALDLIPVTFPHKCFSADPRICTVGYPTNMEGAIVSNAFWKSPDEGNPANDDVELNDLEFAKNQIKKLGNKNDIDNLNNNSNFKLEVNTGLLNNVWLNCEYLRDTIIQFTGERLNVQDFLNKVLSDINICFGDLWNLQIVPGDERNPHMLHIADLNYTSPKARTNQIEAYEFNLKQTSNNVPAHIIRSMNLDSKLAAGFSTMVLYGQKMNDNGNNDNAHSGMKLYTENITDGFKLNNPEWHVYNCEDPLQGSPTENGYSTAGVSTTESGRIETYDIDQYGNPVTYDKNGNPVKSQASLQEEDPVYQLEQALVGLQKDGVTNDTTAAAKAAIQKFVAFINTSSDSEVQKVKNSLPRNSNILLPVYLTLVIDGFGGFKWGNAITIDYLPKRYVESVYFQITKVNHDISEDDWTTTVETIMRMKNKDSNLTGGSLLSNTFSTKNTYNEILKQSGAGSAAVPIDNTSTRGVMQQAQLNMIRNGIAPNGTIKLSGGAPMDELMKNFPNSFNPSQPVNTPAPPPPKPQPKPKPQPTQQPAPETPTGPPPVVEGQGTVVINNAPPTTYSYDVPNMSTEEQQNLLQSLAQQAPPGQNANLNIVSVNVPSGTTLPDGTVTTSDSTVTRIYSSFVITPLRK